MRPLFLFRPEPGWSVTAATARAMELEVHGAPLFVIEAVAWDAPPAEGFDGLLIGSANVFRHGGARLESLDRLPVHAVGEVTADAARSAGFLVGQSGGGGLQGLIDELAGRELRLLRLAGEDRVELALPAGMVVETRVVYRAVPSPLTEKVAADLRSGGVIALHSGTVATRLTEELERLSIDKALFDLVAIGPRVRDLAGTGWRSVEAAAAPEDSAVLAMAKSLCQTSRQ